MSANIFSRSHIRMFLAICVFTAALCCAVDLHGLDTGGKGISPAAIAGQSDDDSYLLPAALAELIYLPPGDEIIINPTASAETATSMLESQHGAGQCSIHARNACKPSGALAYNETEGYLID